MDWMLFWTAFGAIGGTLGAFATAAAVIVTLWQVKHAEKKKLKITFLDSMVMVSANFPSPQESLICLSIINNGNRNVIIQNWGFDYHKKDSHALIGFNQSALLLAINPRLPYELHIDNKIDLYFERKYFIRNLQEGIEKQLLRPESKLTFFVTDSAGKVYRVKSKKTVRMMLQ